jgi:hypothetical protein
MRTSWVLILCVLSTVSLWGDQGIFGGRTDYVKFTAGEVSFSHPEDWRVLPSPPPLAANLSKGDDLTFTIIKNPVEFPTSLNEAFIEYESQELRKQFPNATEFLTTQINHRTLGNVMQVEFTTPPAATGRNKRALRHRFLAVPAGLAVFRIFCVARADEFVKRHQPVFDRVIDSLIITPQAKTGGE